MSRCERVRGELPRILFGEESEIQTAEEREHLRNCPRCREDWERVHKLLGDLAGVEVPDPGETYWRGFLPRLRGRLAAETPSVARGSGWHPVPALAAAASFFVAALVLGSWEPSEVTRAQIRLGEITRREEPDRIQRGLELLLPGPDVLVSSSTGSEWVPGPSDLREALDEILPEDDAELYREAGRLPSESRRWLSEALDPNWV